MDTPIIIVPEQDFKKIEARSLRLIGLGTLYLLFIITMLLFIKIISATSTFFAAMTVFPVMVCVAAINTKIALHKLLKKYGWDGVSAYQIKYEYQSSFLNLE